MKHKHDDNLILYICAIVLFLLAVTARAEDQKPATTFSGFVDVYGALNTNRPDNHENFYPGAGTTAKRGNELAINLVGVQWTRAASADQPVGFTLGLVAGEGTDVVHAAEQGGPNKFRNIYQASVSYQPRNGLLLEGGVYPSHIGFEGFYSKDNWNYTRSIMGESSPYYQAGIKASYAFNSHWSGRVDLLNGWQVINDTNNGKSIGTQIAYTGDALTASLNTFYGPELANDDDSMRKFVDLVAVYKVTPALQLGGTADAGAQEFSGGSDANWWGVGLYGRYTPAEAHALAVRAERFSDPDNGITGFAQKLWEATLTYEYRPSSNLILKFEGRHDHSTAEVFNKRAGGTESQTLAILGAVVTF
jgi:hypothetical protein